MALRIRKDGRILCAAIHSEEPGDTYINDGLHYILSVENKVICTEPHEKHKTHGQWWWIGNVPEGIEIDNFYFKTAKQRVELSHITEPGGDEFFQFRVNGDIFSIPSNKFPLIKSAIEKIISED